MSQRRQPSSTGSTSRPIPNAPDCSARRCSWLSPRSPTKLRRPRADCSFANSSSASTSPIRRRREHESAAGHRGASRRPTASGWPSTPLNKSCAGLPQPDRSDRIRLREVRRDRRNGARSCKLDLRPERGERQKRADRSHTVELDLDTTGQVAGIRTRTSPRRRNSARCWRASPQCQECMVKQYFRYVAGRTRDARGPAADPQGCGGFPTVRFQVQRNDNLNGEAREFPGEGGPVNVAGNH